MSPASRDRYAEANSDAGGAAPVTAPGKIRSGFAGNAGTAQPFRSKKKDEAMNNQTTAVTLRAGAARADITPAMGIQIAGDIGRYRPVEEIRDPLYARALVLDDGRTRVCWVVTDILAINPHWADTIRREAAAAAGCEFSAVMLHATQTHSAPGVGHFFVQDEKDRGVFPKEHPWLLGGDDRYNPVCVRGVVEAVCAAVAAMQPVRVSVGRGMDGRVAFNRRFVMRDGTVRTHPASCDPQILHAEGPADAEVGVLRFDAIAGGTVAVVLHHTCHPTHGYPKRWISADWPGAWCDGVQALCGDGAVPLVLNGFCGNIHHGNHLNPEGSWGDYATMGRKLTETTAKIVERLQPVENPSLDWRVRHMPIPVRMLTPEEDADARGILEKHPEPVWTDASKTAVEWDWVYAASRLDMDKHHRAHPLFDYEVQAFRVGGVGIVAVPGEPFIEEQFRIKQHSPAPFTFTAHMSNGYAGYIPTEAAFRGGGYETRTGAGSKLVPQALTMVGDASLDLLRDLLPPHAGR
jgi:hypothetical protein